MPQNQLISQQAFIVDRNYKQFYELNFYLHFVPNAKWKLYRIVLDCKIWLIENSFYFTSLCFHNTIKKSINIFLYDNIHKVKHLMKIKEQCDKMSVSHPLLLASVYINFWFVICNIFDQCHFHILVVHSSPYHFIMLEQL